MLFLLKKDKVTALLNSVCIIQFGICGYLRDFQGQSMNKTINLHFWTDLALSKIEKFNFEMHVWETEGDEERGFSLFISV